MHYFDFRITSEIQETLNKILSGCLPHENFDVDLAKTALEDLFRTVPIEETYGVTFLFFKVLKNMSTLKMYMSGYKDVLRRDVFDAALSASLDTAIISEGFDAKTFFDEFSVTFNLDIPSEMYDAKSFVYSEALNLYDELFEMAIPTSECSTWIATLRESIEHNITGRMISIAGQALTQGVPVDRKLYRGAADARKLMQFMVSDVNGRVASMNADMTSRHTATVLSSFEKSKEFDEKNKIQIKPLYHMGIDPIDRLFMLSTQDIVTVVADEGVGKTRFAIDQAYRAIMEGCNILYICGETAQIIVKKSLEAMHIFNMYGLQFKPRELLDPSTIEVDDMDKLEEYIVKINNATRDFYENPNHGKFVPLQSVYYETFSEEVKKCVEAYDIEMVFVDHVLALESNGNITPLGRLQTKPTRVTYLYQCEDVLVKEYNIAFFNTSHPSTKTSEELRSGRKPSSRAGAESAESSRYATMVVVLGTNDELKAQDMVIMYVNKIRSDAPIVDDIVLKRNGYGNRHDYDESLQHYAQGARSQFSEAEALALYGEDEEDV